MSTTTNEFSKKWKFVRYLPIEDDLRTQLESEAFNHNLDLDDFLRLLLDHWYFCDKKYRMVVDDR